MTTKQCPYNIKVTCPAQICVKKNCSAWPRLSRTRKTIEKIRTMTETEAITFLEGHDLINAQHCYKRVFGHYIP